MTQPPDQQPTPPSDPAARAPASRATPPAASSGSKPFLQYQTSKDFLIGLFTLIGIGLFVAMFFFIHPRSGDYGELLHARFTDVEGLKKGTRVTWAGEPIGEVRTIRRVDEARKLPPDSERDLYMWELELAVDSSVQVYTSDEVATNTSGLFGEKTIAIRPKAPKKGQTSVPLKQDEIIYAKSSDFLATLMRTVDELGGKVGSAADAITDILAYSREPLHAALVAVGDAAQGIAQVASDVQERQLVATVDSGMRHLDSILGALDQPEELAATLHNTHELTGNFAEVGRRMRDSWPKVDAALSAFSETLVSIGSIARRIDRGEGLAGKLVTSDALYNRIVHLVDQANDLLGSMGQHGLLFHLNRGWQREQTERRDLVHQIRTPEQLSSYFNAELDGLAISVSRLCEQLTVAREERDYCGQEGNPELEAAACDVLQQVEQLEKDLDLINQALLLGC
jgi:phospholipid/cholesterol/gamma-HCH transport system substrate-binding protein